MAPPEPPPFAAFRWDGRCMASRPAKPASGHEAVVWWARPSESIG
jgi:hypothetical protein